MRLHNRRRFLEILGVTGSVVALRSLGAVATARADADDPQLLLFVQFEGAWDQLLALDPRNPERDLRDAATYLDRLLAEYPQSPLMAEALTWRRLIQTVERQQRDLRRSQQDVERLSRELRREQQERLRLQAERERLRQVDEELERPRRSGDVPTMALPVWRPE